MSEARRRELRIASAELADRREVDVAVSESVGVALRTHRKRCAHHPTIGTRMALVANVRHERHPHEDRLAEQRRWFMRDPQGHLAVALRVKAQAHAKAPRRTHLDD